MQKPYLKIFKSDVLINTIELYQKFFVVGRDASYCDLALDSQSVSRIHATFLRPDFNAIGFHYVLIDGAVRGPLSTNGVKVNKDKCDYYWNLSNNDVIEIAEFKLKYHEADHVSLSTFQT